MRNRWHSTCGVFGVILFLCSIGYSQCQDHLIGSTGSESLQIKFIKLQKSINSLGSEKLKVGLSEIVLGKDTFSDVSATERIKLSRLVIKLQQTLNLLLERKKSIKEENRDFMQDKMESDLAQVYTIIWISLTDKSKRERFNYDRVNKALEASKLMHKIKDGTLFFLSIRDAFLEIAPIGFFEKCRP